MSNAIKFTKPDGKVIIQSEQKEGFTHLSISDQGPGMDETTVSQIFAFNLKSVQGSHGEKGFGLGLKLCHEFATMNHGKIKVNSQLGKGSVFEIILPSKGQGKVVELDVA